MQEFIYGSYPIIFVGILYLVFLQADKIVSRHAEIERKERRESRGAFIQEIQKKDEMIFRLAMLLAVGDKDVVKAATAIEKLEGGEESPAGKLANMPEQALYGKISSVLQSRDIKDKQAGKFSGG